MCNKREDELMSELNLVDTELRENTNVTKFVRYDGDDLHFSFTYVYDGKYFYAADWKNYHPNHASPETFMFYLGKLRQEVQRLVYDYILECNE